jgi:HNH endonuclease
MDYRKLWESHNGPIPKDKDGRSYEIHHIDGNHQNNVIQNLKLVTIQEHYDVHYSQGDYGACLAIIMRMDVPVEVSKKLQSKLSKAVAAKRIAEGTHNFSSELSKKVQKDRIANGTHNFQGEQGSLNAVQRNKKLVELGKHPWAGELGKIHNKKLAAKRVVNGTHNFQGEMNPNKNMPKVTCPYCNKVGGRNQMKRYHFDNCKNKE